MDLRVEITTAAARCDIDGLANLLDGRRVEEDCCGGTLYRSEGGVVRRCGARCHGRSDFAWGPRELCLAVDEERRGSNLSRGASTD